MQGCDVLAVERTTQSFVLVAWNAFLIHGEACVMILNESGRH